MNPEMPHSEGDKAPAHVQLGAPLAQAWGAVLLLHGRGSSGEAIAGLVEALTQEGLAFLIPDAAGGSWYPRRFLAPLAQNEPWLTRALRLVDALVRRANGAGIPFHRVGIVGFSQGGCLGLEYAIRHPRRYGLIAGLSSALIGPLDLDRAEADLQRTPILVACAEQDAHIPLPFVEQSVATLARCNAAVAKLLFPGDAHTVYPEEVAWVRQALSSW